MTPSTLCAGPRPSARSAVLRWLLVSLVLTGVIAMHVLSQHDAGGGHHGSIIDEPTAAVSGFSAHDGHGAVEMVASVPAVGTPTLMPAVPSGGDPSMAACILFLVAGAGAALLALLAALRRRSRPLSARSSSTLVTAVPRGPPYIGPPRISLCVLRV